MSLSRRSRGVTAINIWPGFVDALAALLMVVIFVLLVFMVAQFYMSNLLSGQEQQVARLRADIEDLEARLLLEADANDELAARFSQLQADYNRLGVERATLDNALGDADRARARLEAELAALQGTLEEREADLALAAADLGEAARRITGDAETIERQRFELTELGDEIESLRLLRDTLRLQIDSLTAAARAAQAEAERADAEREAMRVLIDPLQTDLATARQQVGDLEAALGDADRRVADLAAAVTTLGAEQAALIRRLALAQAGADATRAELALAERSMATVTEDTRQVEIGRDVAIALAQRLEVERQDLAAALSLAAGRIRALEALLEERTAERVGFDRQLADRDGRIADLEADLAAAWDSAATAALQLRMAGQETARLEAALQADIDRLRAALAESESRVDDRDQEIAGLEARLNQALLREVEELSRYRSDFFGRLRAVMAGRAGVAVVGDRFVFQSEVLFPTGSARLEPAGRQRLTEFAQSLLALSEEVPPDIDWVLRVDGHTDRRPINSPEFPSNWELSTARAVRVVRFLEDQGVPADRLAAAGFAAFQPIDEGDSETALARNRRIELRLDQR